jgi:hypothetical protein
MKKKIASYRKNSRIKRKQLVSLNLVSSEPSNATMVLLFAY